MEHPCSLDVCSHVLLVLSSAVATSVCEDGEFVGIAPDGEVLAVFEEFFAVEGCNHGSGGMRVADEATEVVDGVCEVVVLPEVVGSGAVGTYYTSLVFDGSRLEERAPGEASGFGP